MNNFFLFDMENPSQEIKLDFEFNETKVLFCNFNNKGELVLFCMGKNNRGDKIKIVCVYSIQTKNKPKPSVKKFI